MAKIREGAFRYEAQRRATVARNARRSAITRDHARDLLPLVVELRLGGLETRAALARELNARGIKTAAGNQWYSSTVGRLLDASNEAVRQARLRRDEERHGRRGAMVRDRERDFLPLVVELRLFGGLETRAGLA